MIKKTFRVEEMHCTNCVMKVESIEDDLPAIREISASYVKQQMVVEYDENHLTDEQIIAAVRGKGYQAVPM
jgi:copper chaperone CopZ